MREKGRERGVQGVRKRGEGGREEGGEVHVGSVNAKHVHVHVMRCLLNISTRGNAVHMVSFLKTLHDKQK